MLQGLIPGSECEPRGVAVYFELQYILDCGRECVVIG